MDSRFISVVIPCFNHGRFLEEAVQSVLSQTHQDFEILIVDDGSTDRATRELIESLDRPKTKTVRIENRGLSGARNYGIEHTSHAFVCALDADDVLEPTWFERALEVFELEENVSFVSHWLRTFGDEEWEWKPERCDLAALLDTNTVNGAAVVRREALLEVGLFDETMRDGCEDWDLWLRMVERGKRGVILPESLFRYRRRADSMSRAMNRPDVQVGLFHRLTEQHPESYRRHLKDLLLRRETSLCDLRGEIFDLEREYQNWWLPELERRRVEIRELEQKIASARQRREERAKLARFEHVEADLAGHREALENAQAELDVLQNLQSESQARCQEQLGEIEELRRLGLGDRERIARLQDDLAGHRQALDDSVQEKRALLEERRHVLADLEGHEKALLDDRAEIGELRRLQAESEDRARDLLSDLEGHRAALGDAKADIAAIRQSRSWRWTSWLRSLLGGNPESGRRDR